MRPAYWIPACWGPLLILIRIPVIFAGLARVLT